MHRDAIYVRVSDTRDPDAPSLDSQEASCRRHSQASGGDVAAVHRETQTGIEFWQRPVLQQLVAQAQSGAYDRVIFHSIDRMSRDPEHLTAVKVMLAMGGAMLVCVSEPIPQDDTGILVQFVRGWASKREWTQIRERSMRGRRQRLERGMLGNAGRDLYGYVRDREAGTRQIVDSEAAVVRRIFKLVVEQRLSLAAIARQLNQDGIPSPLARRGERPDARWGSATLRTILRHPAYRGETIGWRHQSREHGRRMRVIRPDSEWVRLPDGVTPAIVTDETWEAAQRVLAANVGDTARNQQRPYLLRGLVFCGVCGRRLRAEATRENRYYRCGSRDGQNGPCGARLVPAGDVEQWAWLRASRRIADPRLIAAGVTARAGRGTAALERERAGLEKRLAQIQRGQDRLLAHFRESDRVPWDAVERQVSIAEHERRQVEGRISELAGRIAAITGSQQHNRELHAWCALAADNLARFDFDGQRLALETIGARITAAGNDYTTWQYADDL